MPAQTPRRGDYKKTRKMAVGRYKDGNRVGAMAMAEQGGVTASIVATKERIVDERDRPWRFSLRASNLQHHRIHAKVPWPTC